MRRILLINPNSSVATTEMMVGIAASTTAIAMIMLQAEAGALRRARRLAPKQFSIQRTSRWPGGSRSHSDAGHIAKLGAAK